MGSFSCTGCFSMRSWLSCCTPWVDGWMAWVVAGSSSGMQLLDKPVEDMLLVYLQPTAVQAGSNTSSGLLLTLRLPCHPPCALSAVRGCARQDQDSPWPTGPCQGPPHSGTHSSPLASCCAHDCSASSQQQAVLDAGRDMPEPKQPISARFSWADTEGPFWRWLAPRH
jgi:hypothetical protein